MKLKGPSRGESVLTLKEYVNTFCIHDTQKLGTQVHTASIANFPLKFILNMITKVTGSGALHLASWVFMHIGVECF